jgi:hypothetical protein
MPGVAGTASSSSSAQPPRWPWWRRVWAGAPGSIATASATAWEPRHAADLVECAVYAPGCVARGETILLNVFAYLAPDALRVDQLASEFDTRSHRRAFTCLEMAVNRMDQLTFDVSADGCVIDNPTRHVTWRGEVAPACLAGPIDRRPSTCTFRPWASAPPLLLAVLLIRNLGCELVVKRRTRGR